MVPVEPLACGARNQAATPTAVTTEMTIHLRGDSSGRTICPYLLNLAARQHAIDSARM